MAARWSSPAGGILPLLLLPQSRLRSPTDQPNRAVQPGYIPKVL